VGALMNPWIGGWLVDSQEEGWAKRQCGSRSRQCHWRLQMVLVLCRRKGVSCRCDSPLQGRAAQVWQVHSNWFFFGRQAAKLQVAWLIGLLVLVTTHQPRMIMRRDLFLTFFVSLSRLPSWTCRTA
jgi:hypothetical protein